VSELYGIDGRAPRWGPGLFGWSQHSVDGVVVIRLTGELDLSADPELRRRLMRVVETGPAATIVVDLSGLRFIDAHCFGVIVSAWAAGKCRGRHLRVDGLHGVPARVFELLKLEQILAHGTGEDQAGGDTRGRAGGVAARRR
jgi:anti-anti-sigma factor